MEPTTLTDHIQVRIFKTLYRAKQLKDKHPELYENIYKLSDILTQLLLDPDIETNEQFLEEIKNRKYLIDEGGELEYDTNSEFNNLECSIQEYFHENSRNNELTKLQEDFNQLIQWCNSDQGSTDNRFELQELPIDNTIQESRISFIKNKPEKSAIIVSDLEKIEGKASKNYVIKRITKPGKTVVLNNVTHQQIVVGKKGKDPLESKHFNAWIRKEEKNEPYKDVKNFVNKAEYSESNTSNSIYNMDDYLTRRYFNNHVLFKENEALNSSLIGILDESSYKIRPISETRAIQIKIVKDAFSLKEFFHLNNSQRTFGNNIIRTRISKFNKEELKKYTRTFLIGYFIGLDDRINEENILYDQSKGIFYNIDLTDRLGMVHQERLLSSAECIKNKNLKLFREKFIEFLFEEAYHKTMKWNPLYFGLNKVQYKVKNFSIEEKELMMESDIPITIILNRCLEELSDAELLEIIKDLTTDDKVQQVEELYKEYLDNFGDKQRDKNGKDIFYNPGIGIRAISKAIKEMKTVEEPSLNIQTAATIQVVDTSEMQLPTNIGIVSSNTRWYTRFFLFRIFFTRSTTITSTTSEVQNNQRMQSNNIDTGQTSLETNQPTQTKSQTHKKNFIVTSISSLFSRYIGRNNDD